MNRLCAIALIVVFLASPTVAQEEAPQAEFGQRFAELALACVHEEYPNKIGHVLSSDDDVAPPRELTPSFFGCFDWHSSVHGHWLLARLARSFPEASYAPAARAALARSLSVENLRVEVEYLKGEGRTSFERPYGLAWLLQLAAELHQWSDDEVQSWRQAILPLEEVAADRFREWLPKLDYAIRTGEHSQTAFAFGLVLDWARGTGDKGLEQLLEERILTLYGDDKGCPLGYEPSGQDFLSPCLAEADLMRRVFSPSVYAAWLGAFLPEIPLSKTSSWLEPALVSDPSDPKLAHLDGLNISRAWMLEGIASGLPAKDPRVPAIMASACSNRRAGLSAVTGKHYEGGHWLGSFATYLVTQRGLPVGNEVGECGAIEN